MFSVSIEFWADSYLLLVLKKCCASQAWQYMTVLLSFGGLRQEDLKFQASLGNIARPHLNKQTNR
jgi:hypothetical protein